MKPLSITRNGVIYIPSPIEVYIMLGLILGVVGDSLAYYFYRKLKRNLQQSKEKTD